MFASFDGIPCVGHPWIHVPVRFIQNHESRSPLSGFLFTMWISSIPSQTKRSPLGLGSFCLFSGDAIINGDYLLSGFQVFWRFKSLRN
jgi:hypothetical protein